jgi:hypothetical protein
VREKLMKFAGLFVEKIPVEEQSGQARGAVRAPQSQPMQGYYPSPPGSTAQPAQQQPTSVPQQVTQPLAVGLRAWVPQEYATFLMPHGLHVIAAGGELTIDQARSYGAQVLIVSAECLGSHTHLLSSPQVPTVFIAPQAMLIPTRPGVVQVTEPLRASEVAAACREAVATWPNN